MTQELLAIVHDAHKWALGPTYSRGTAQYSRDQCRICGLIREWQADPMRGVYRYDFSPADQSGWLSVEKVVDLPCIEKPAPERPAEEGQ